MQEMRQRVAACATVRSAHDRLRFPGRPALIEACTTRGPCARRPWPVPLMRRAQRGMSRHASTCPPQGEKGRGEQSCTTYASVRSVRPGCSISVPDVIMMRRQCTYVCALFAESVYYERIPLPIRTINKLVWPVFKRKNKLV